LRRTAGILSLLVRHGFGDVIDRFFRGGAPKDVRSDEPPARRRFPNPRRIRIALEELGPTFIKLGQMMSSRADIFPPDYIAEFRKLQDQIPPVPFSEIEKLIEDQLRRPLGEAFSQFEKQPLAAASVAQVHLASLPDREEVAVKVIRPGIRKKIREDIRIMYSLAERFERSFEAGRIIGAVVLVREFERTISKELDMYIEAGSMEKFRQNFKESPEIHIPKVHWDHTTKSVLVMEHIRGIKMDLVEEIKRTGLDPKAIALLGLRAFSRQLMEFGLFHADPHPGNTIVMKDGRVALLDFGIVGYLDRTTMLHLSNLFLGFAEHNYDMVIDALAGAGVIHEQTMELGDFRGDLEDVAETFYGRSLNSITMKDIYDQVMQLVFKYRIRLPRNLLLLLKTLVQTEALGKILNSDASILEITRPYAVRFIGKEQNILSRVSKDAREMGGHIKAVPKLVRDILSQVAQGKQRLNLVHRFKDLDTQIERPVNRLTIGLIIGASIIGGSLALNSSEKVMDINVHAFGIGTISLTALLGIIGYVIATALGLWLIVSIIFSRKL
jgi:ubiquinone biosynthesis protein